MRPFSEMDDLEERVDAHVRRQKRITRYVFLGVNALLFFIFAFISMMLVVNTPELASLSENARDALIASGVLLTTGWAMSIFFQMMIAIFDSGMADASMRRQALTHIMADQMLESSRRYREKPKRAGDADEVGRMVLGEDGELIDPEDSQRDADHLMEEYYNQQEQRRQRR